MRPSRVRVDVGVCVDVDPGVDHDAAIRERASGVEVSCDRPRERDHEIGTAGNPACGARDQWTGKEIVSLLDERWPSPESAQRGGAGQR